jgi:hypothetical protein
MAIDYGKYNLYRKYKTEDGVNYTPLDEYQAVFDGSLYNCDCGYREKKWRKSNPLELVCGRDLGDEYNYYSTAQYVKYYEWEYCPTDEKYDEKTGNIRYEVYKSNSCTCGYYYTDFIADDTKYLSYNDVDDECVYIYRYDGWGTSVGIPGSTSFEGIFTNDLSYYESNSREYKRIYFTSKNNILVLYCSVDKPSDGYKRLTLDGVSISPKKGFNYYELSGDTTTEHIISYLYENTGTDSRFYIYMKGVNENYMFYPVVETQVCEGNVVATLNKYYLPHNVAIKTELVTEPTQQRIIARCPSSSDELITYSELMSKNEESNNPYCGYIIPSNYYKTMIADFNYCCGSNAEGTKFPAYPSYSHNGIYTDLSDNMSGTITFEQSDNFTYLNYANNGYCVAPWKIVSMDLVEGAEETMINAVWKYYYNVTNDGTKTFIKKEFVKYE